jgi:hypothetical protein
MDTLIKFLVFPWETFSSFFMQLSKRKTHLPISPTSLAQSGTDPNKYLLIYMEYMVVVTKGTPN